MLTRLLILGAGGDLTRRYLLPALADLCAAGRLPRGLEITAAERGTTDTDGYRQRVKEWLEAHAPDVPLDVRTTLPRMVVHRRADATDATALAPLVQGEPLAVYLALPPAVFGPTIQALKRAGLPEGSRLAIEKPFGTSLEHARQLNELLSRCLTEDAVFRIDHFLGLQTVQNIIGLRFANPLLSHVWNADHVQRVEILWDETLTLEGRGYYDAVGALKDMVQNHLLQLLALVAMEPLEGFHPGELRDRKTEVLGAVRRLTAEEVERRTVRARYAAGRIGDRDVPAYVDEETVDPSRGTETFAEVSLAIDNPRWSEVPFILRTGKALGADRREIRVILRPVPVPGLAGPAEGNLLRISLDPEALALELNINAPGEEFRLRRVELCSDLAPPPLSAYARVLQAVLQGDATLSIRGDEAEESWAIVEPILEAWQSGRPPLRTYPAGSPGPDVGESAGEAAC